MSDIKLKEIKPYMAILCHNEEQGKAVEEQLLKQGAGWSGFNKRHYGRKATICYLNREGRFSFNSQYEHNTEFSDLIELELTAEEVLSIFGEIIHECDNDLECDDCPLSCVNVNNGEKQDLCERRAFKGNEQKIIEICKQWKVDHEKKEPKVELQEAARPLVEYLRKNYHPHATAIVSLDYAEVLEGKESAKYGEEV